MVVQPMPPSPLQGRVQNPPGYGALPLEVESLQYAPPPMAEQAKLEVQGSPMLTALAVQTPAGQPWPLGQVTHAFPLVPQLKDERPVVQKPFWQQPVGQVVALHWGAVHWPLVQLLPGAQG